MRVLIVEDNHFLSSLFSSFFSSRGWSVDSCFSAPTARGLFEAGRYDLVLCDIELPGDDGVSLAQALLQAHPRQRVVMTSGSLNNISRARQSGLDECLPKPFSFEELCILVAPHEGAEENS